MLKGHVDDEKTTYESERKPDSELDTSNPKRQKFESVVGKISVWIIGGCAFVFKADDIITLRLHHRICGRACGTSTQQPNQNKSLGPPIKLLPEELQSLLDENIAFPVQWSDSPGQRPDLYEIEGQVSQLTCLANSKMLVNDLEMPKRHSVRENDDYYDDDEKPKMINVIPRVTNTCCSTNKGTCLESSEQSKCRDWSCKHSQKKKKKKATEVSNAECQERRLQLSKQNQDDMSPVEDHDEPVTNVRLGIETETVLNPDQSTQATPTGVQQGVHEKPKGSRPVAMDTEEDPGVLCSEVPYVDPFRYRVFRHFRHLGMWLTDGEKFGGDFMIYPNDPLTCHACAVVICVEGNMPISRYIVSIGRLANTVHKSALLCFRKNHCQDRELRIERMWSA